MAPETTKKTTKSKKTPAAKATPAPKQQPVATIVDEPVVETVPKKAAPAESRVRSRRRG